MNVLRVKVKKSGSVQVKLEHSRSDGYLVIYAKFREGKIKTTYELSAGVAADVDAEGRVLGVEVVKTFSTKAKKIRLSGMINLGEIQKKVEKRFGISMDSEFDQIREATAALAPT